MDKFIQEEYSTQCDDFRPEDGDDSGFVDHGADCGVDVAV